MNNEYVVVGKYVEIWFWDIFILDLFYIFILMVGGFLF